ncbi:hypothetical protein [Endozoicomonas numazuensis]|uniref:Uncharacterized protein n=1 Tax=Endozoicomonas numazuensis TaxID=1137799 RepID=A0A081NI78_9GAMM|nr:hypothetical protein [Endozoicomonas numazuensis]KEQ18151.1 hypothetical protein GZ78_11380 [Endozoicomonas numazuensis]
MGTSLSKGINSTPTTQKCRYQPEATIKTGLWDDIKSVSCTEFETSQVNQTALPLAIVKAGQYLEDHGFHPDSGLTPELLKNWNKGSTWFQSLMHLHFKGLPVEQFSDEQLGLTQPGGMDEITVYRGIIKKLKEHSGARTPEDYLAFMSWLATVNMLEEFPYPPLVNALEDWEKSMRAELCSQVTTDARDQRLPFDGNPFHQPNKSKLHFYLERFEGMKYDLLKSLLSEAPSELTTPLMSDWLQPEDSAPRKALFKQQFYPLNTLQLERYQWNHCINTLVQKLPETADTPFYVSMKADSIELPMSPPHEATHCHQTCGRTLIEKLPDGSHRYIKIQSENESASDFQKCFYRLQKIEKHKEELELESTAVCTEKVFKIDDVSAYLEASSIPPAHQRQVLSITGDSPRLAMSFTTPPGVQYEEYFYDVETPSEAFEGLAIYGRDYGRLWRQKLIPPSLITADHDVTSARKHLVFASLLHCFSEGCIDRWHTEASNYPNSGGSKMGMRDKGDTCLPSEAVPYYKTTFKHMGIGCSKESTQSLNSIRVNELGRAAQGMILQYARRFNQSFNPMDSEKCNDIAKDIEYLLAGLFSQAFALSKEQCQLLMREADLLNQCAREVNYWLASGSPYVEDIRSAVINRKVYPHLPENMQACILTEGAAEQLRDTGFFRPPTYMKGDIKLGSPNGKNPLIALNALMTKLTSAGIVAMLDEQKREKQSAAQKVASAQYCA